MFYHKWPNFGLHADLVKINAMYGNPNTDICLYRYIHKNYETLPILKFFVHNLTVTHGQSLAITKCHGFMKEGLN